MKECYIILKKEIRNFAKRKAMVRWYFWIIVMNSFMLLLPKYDFIEISKNKDTYKKIVDNLSKDSFDRTNEFKKIEKLLEE